MHLDNLISFFPRIFYMFLVNFNFFLRIMLLRRNKVSTNLNVILSIIKSNIERPTKTSHGWCSRNSDLLLPKDENFHHPTDHRDIVDV